MKLSVMQENLARGLSVVSRAVSNRSLPVLTNVLLKTEDAGLKLTATNLEMQQIQTSFFLKGLAMTGGALLITQLGVRRAERDSLRLPRS